MTPSEVVQSYLGAFASHEATEVAAWVSEGFVNEHTAALGSGCAGRSEYLRRLPDFFASIDGLRYEVHELIEAGHRVAAAYTLHGSHRDRPIAVRGVMLFEVEGSLITRRTDYWDSLVFLRQAGLSGEEQ